MKPEEFMAVLPDLPDSEIADFKQDTDETQFEKNLQYLAAVSFAVFIGAFLYI